MDVTGDAGHRPIEAVVFDMDGVLLDSEPIWRDVEREVFARVGVELTDRDLVETMGVRIADVVDRWYRRRPWIGPSTDEIVDAVVAGVADRVQRRGTLHEGAQETVDRLADRGLRLALASSSPMRLIGAVLSLGDLADRFDAVVSAEDEDRGKPDPAVFLSAARGLRVRPERCLVVEDSIAGVRAAKAAGMLCVAIPEPAVRDGIERLADLVLDSLAGVDDAMWERLGAVPVPASSPG